LHPAGIRYKYRLALVRTKLGRGPTMKCPACGAIDDKVIDSRLGKDNAVIRRRRECLECQKRFTTYERVEEILPFVIKKDGRRESFDRRKIIEGMRRACQKRPISTERIESVADSIEQELMEGSEKEISVTFIGEKVMDALRQMDEVAYVRFASVYRSFRDIEEFITEIKELYELKESPDHSGSRSGSPDDPSPIHDSP
jgi:transcriptional repressor NrdR